MPPDNRALREFRCSRRSFLSRILVAAGYTYVVHTTSKPETLAQDENTELVTNGGFEDGMAGWTQGIPAAQSVTITDETSHSGEYSLKIVGLTRRMCDERP